MISILMKINRNNRKTKNPKKYQRRKKALESLWKDVLHCTLRSHILQKQEVQKKVKRIKPTYVRRTISVPADIYEQYIALAIVGRFSISAYMRNVLCSHIENNKNKGKLKND